MRRTVLSAVSSLGRYCVVTVLFLAGNVVHALTISPVLVELSPARRIVSITITNPGDRPIRFQTSTLSWTQSGGVDRYGETDELLVVPPIAEIPARGSQIFRVTTRMPFGPDERAYRLIFEDITEAVAPSADEVSINVRVNHDVPVFAEVAGKPRAVPRIGPCTGPSSASAGCVRIDNDGDRYLQLKSLTVEGDGWHKDLAAARVLAGAWRQWTFDVPAAISGALRVRATTADEVLRFELPLLER
jgi:fimbrial chaperone protein